jgi:inner membrane protein
MDFGSLEAHWWWLLGAALLGILEIFFPGVFLIWMAAAAAVTGIAVALTPLPVAIQLILFALLAIAAVYAGRRYYERNPVPSSDPLLNDRTARLVGQRVTVVKAIAHGEGRVRVGDGVWAASGPDAEEGSTMVVTGAHGTCLEVEAIPSLPPSDANG